MEREKKQLHWKTKKYIVQVVCVIVLIGTMGISLLEQSSEDKLKGSAVAGKQIVENATSTNIYMENSVVEEAEESSVKMTTNNKKERVESSNVNSSESQTNPKDASLQENVSSNEQATKLSKRKSGKSGSANRVVNHIAKQGIADRNCVEKNQEPLYLIEKIFENHGTVPMMANLLQKYQFPIEIGYSIDRNYDGKNAAGDFILNKVYDTKDVSEEESSDTSKDSDEKEDNKVASGEASGDAKVASQTEESDMESVSGDAVEERNKDMASGDTVEEREGSSDSQEASEDQTEMDVDSENLQEQGVASSDVPENVEENQQEISVENASGDAQEDLEEILKDAKGREDIEVKRLETYRKSVWKKVMATDAKDVELTEQQGSIVVTENVTKASGDTADQTENAIASGEVVAQTENASGDASEWIKKEITAGYYIVKGKMRKGSDVYVSDIEIIPAGVDGFNKVRIGEDGEFVSSLLITEDAVEKDVDLYFTDGEQVTDATTFTYSKDTVKPTVEMVEEGLHKLQSTARTIYCTNQSNIKLLLQDGKKDIKDTIEKVQFLYGDKLKSVENGWKEPQITIEEDFYGRLLLNAKDKAGNVSGIQSQFVLVDHNAPEVVLAQDVRCSAPYTLWTTISEVGHIVSGIQSVQCVVNGQMYDVTDAVVNETYTLDEGLEVSSKITFPIDMPEVGIYAVNIRVKDYAGNETLIERNIEVTEPELVSVYMPKNFTIHIDPQQLAGKEQIYSDNVELKNVSKFDVRVRIDEVILNVKDEMSDEGVRKDCELYLIAPDTGEKIKLSKGSNKDVYSYRLLAGTEVDISNLQFVGTLTDGSERMWKGSDISLQLKLSFYKWEK